MKIIVHWNLDTVLGASMKLADKSCYVCSIYNDVKQKIVVDVSNHQIYLVIS